MAPGVAKPRPGWKLAQFSQLARSEMLIVTPVSAMPLGTSLGTSWNLEESSI